ERPATAGRCYDVGGGERLAFTELLARIRASLPVRTLALPLPAGGLRAFADRVPAGRRWRAPLARLGTDLVAEHAAAVSELGWMPRGFRPDAASWRPAALP